MTRHRFQKRSLLKSRLCYILGTYAACGFEISQGDDYETSYLQLVQELSRQQRHICFLHLCQPGLYSKSIPNSLFRRSHLILH